MNSKKRKGKSLENKIAEFLRETFNTDSRHIKRNISSGTQIGEESDINIIDSEIEARFPFIIEAKNQEKWKLSDLLSDNVNRKSNPFISYLEQLNVEVETYYKRYNVHKKGLLIFSKAYYPIYVMVKHEDIQDINFADLSFMHVNINNQWYYVFELKSFLTLFKK